MGRADDPDTITQAGMYYMTANTTNAPLSTGFVLLHIAANGRIAQIAFVNGASNNFYIRSKPTTTGATYTKWRRLLTGDDLNYKSGDTISISGVWINGTLTSSKNYIYITIPLQKNIIGTTSFIPKLLTVRQSGLYLADTISAFSGYEFNVMNSGNIGIRVRMSRTGGWGGTNNETVAVYLEGTISIQ